MSVTAASALMKRGLAAASSASYAAWSMVKALHPARTHIERTRRRAIDAFSTSVSTSGSRCGSTAQAVTKSARSAASAASARTAMEKSTVRRARSKTECRAPSATEGSGRGAARRQATATVVAVVAVTREEMEDLVVGLVTVRTNEEREEREQEREEARDVIVTESGR